MTALATASLSCSSYIRKATQSLGTYVINKGVDADADAEKLTPTPSLVGLAINYTLLVPIYLNWVVKLFADMEMYAGSVERIAGYTQQQEHEQEEQEQPQQELLHVDSRNEVDRSLAVDKVYPSATSAVTALALQEDSAKLNAPEQEKEEVEKETNHLNLTTIKDARRQRQLAAAAADKAAIANEPARRNKICEYKHLIYHRFSGHISQLICDYHEIKIAYDDQIK